MSTMQELDRPLRALLERIAAPAAMDPPDLPAIGGALVDLASDIDYMRAWVERLGGEPGARNLALQAPADGPRLMMVHRPEGQMSAVHDHGTWVAIASVEGIETHRRYQSATNGSVPRIELVEALELGPAQGATLLPPDDIHDHGHIAGRGDPAYVLIMTGEDQTRFTRNEWDLATGRHRILHPGEQGRWLATEPMPD
jgi:predicted metal-dependent enzyme (double-stranded beta helix superfamily)